MRTRRSPDRSLSSLAGLLAGAALALCLLLPALAAAADATIAPDISGRHGALRLESTRKVNEHYTVTTYSLDGAPVLEQDTINGPPTPPPGADLQPVQFDAAGADAASGVTILTVPAYSWVFGCSSVSGAMIAGYYDRNGYARMYAGPTGDGLMPLDNSSWARWRDSVDEEYPNLPLAASHQGVDGRSILGSIDDYWDYYDSTNQDPYITAARTQHTWGSAIGDYMKTSQSAYGNTDGSTKFYNYSGSYAAPLTCADMETPSGTGSYEYADLDGTYGRKLFYEARGYTVTDCYNQRTDNVVSGGFTFAQYKAEIDAGRPVMLNLVGHTVVGVGYDDTDQTVYLHNTWDYQTYSMTWGGSYSGMAMLSVSIVNLAPAPHGGLPWLELLLGD